MVREISMDGLKRILNYIRGKNGIPVSKLKSKFEFKVNGKTLTFSWENGSAKSIFVQGKRKLTIGMAIKALEK